MELSLFSGGFDYSKSKEIFYEKVFRNQGFAMGSCYRIQQKIDQGEYQTEEFLNTIEEIINQFWCDATKQKKIKKYKKRLYQKLREILLASIVMERRIEIYRTENKTAPITEDKIFYHYQEILLKDFQTIGNFYFHLKKRKKIKFQNAA